MFEKVDSCLCPIKKVDSDTLVDIRAECSKETERMGNDIREGGATLQ